MVLSHNHEVDGVALAEKRRLKAPLTDTMKEQAKQMSGEAVHASMLQQHYYIV